MTNSIQAALIEKIIALGKSEKVSKALLAELSRELLVYITQEGGSDVATLNRLLAVLTPANKAKAIEYFKAFIPHAFDKESETFGGVYRSEKKHSKITAACNEWLAEESNDMWSWDKSAADKKFELEKALQAIIKKSVKASESPEDFALISTAVSPDTVLAIMELLGQAAASEQQLAA